MLVAEGLRPADLIQELLLLRQAGLEPLGCRGAGMALRAARGGACSVLPAFAAPNLNCSAVVFWGIWPSAARCLQQLHVITHLNLPRMQQGLRCARPAGSMCCA